MNRSRFYTAGLVLILLAITVSTIISIRANRAADRGVKLTCRIQDRGLEATPHQVQAMNDIGKLLAPVGSRATPLLPPEDIPIFINLREEIATYVVIEREQPLGRKC